LILSPPLSSQAALLARLDAGQLPHALIAPPAPSRWGVSIDDEAAARLATAHLIELGHRRIGFIGGHPDLEASAQRQRGHELALREAGISDSARMIEPGEFTFESGRRAAFRLLARTPRPTAIVAGNDDMAAGVISAARASGLALPGELSVVGFDDTPLARMLWPSLTTMHQPIDEMAMCATRLLLERLGTDRPAPAATALEYRLVRRGSTCAPA
jgi:LacI family transcriptional regulator